APPRDHGPDHRRPTVLEPRPRRMDGVQRRDLQRARAAPRVRAGRISVPLHRRHRDDRAVIRAPRAGRRGTARRDVRARRVGRPTAAVAAGPSRLDAPATLRATLLRAVERELMSDVPVGVFTSGGLDSSLLAAAAARVMPGEQIHTYSVRFVEPGYDESPYAEAVTHHIRTQHHVVAADEPALERAFTTITRGLAEPVGDPAILPTYLLAEAAREDVKVVLSGEGADELFGGYPTYLG